MPKVKPKLTLIEGNFQEIKAKKNSDFAYIIPDNSFEGYGFIEKQELYFQQVMEFNDGDFIAVKTKCAVNLGFGFSINNAILVALVGSYAIPKKEITYIGKLLNQMDLCRFGFKNMRSK